MKKFIFQAVRMVTLLIAISILSFLMMAKSPVDPLTAYIGTNSTISEEAKEEIAEYWGLNEPPLERFLAWAGNTLRGDFGESIVYKQPVLTVIKERFRYSLALMLIAWLSSGILGFLLGIGAAVCKDSVLDKTLKMVCLTFQSAPTFWVGLLMLSIFAVNLGWFPIGLAAPMGKVASEVTVGERIHHLVLPSVTLSILGIGKITLYTRQKLLEILGSEFILYARARGESVWQIVKGHGIKNIAIPAITVQFASFSELFGGIALAETVFSYPGIGSAVTAAGLGGDVPLLLGIAIFSAIFVFAGNLIANILYGIVDPRIREGVSHE
ncbi:ABC transporter permease [Petralouisia muris]|jgi:peptide/nickel transport system permease protein|uniref:ABC transporter permease n=1 Tax=Petralouisia muris TaxID=3032872 RepID=A0AC61RYU2_9FIRM|nr:ABC transporter permease [Petralouisia muris]TGY97065.1 ABC transporter permease [Petralouisia muris]